MWIPLACFLLGAARESRRLDSTSLQLSCLFRVSSSRMAQSTLRLGSAAISRDLPVSSSYIRRLCRRGLLPAVKLGRRWTLDLATIDAVQHAIAAAYLRRLATVGTHPTAAQHTERSERSLTPGRGVASAPRAHGTRTPPYKKRKGLGRQAVDNKRNSAGTPPPGNEPLPQLISLTKQGDGR